jgi:4-aminobutyrate aminotransferase
MLLMCGQSTVRFMPPLLISEADVDEAIALLTQSLDEVLTDQRPVDRGVAAV